jgi:hypothetical protein
MCSVAQWLVRWAAVRQPRVRIPPGTPPSVQPDESFTQTQEFIYPAGEDQPEDEYCINVCLVRKIQKKEKKIAGNGTKLWEKKQCRTSTSCIIATGSRRLPRITNTGSRQLSVSTMQRVYNFQHQQYGEFSF